MMTSEQMNVLFHLPLGKDNAVSREELSASAGYSDRLTRKIIAQLRENGYLICNFGGGYYISTDLDDIERQYRQDTARAMSILKRRKAMRKILKECGRKV